MKGELPHWDVSNVFPGLDSPELEAALLDYSRQINDLSEVFDQRIDKIDEDKGIQETATLLGGVIERLNQIYTLESTLRAYIAAFVTTDSKNALAARRNSQFDQRRLPFVQLETRFTSWVGRLLPVLDQLISENRTCREHTFCLYKTADQSKFLMSAAEENLAAELNLSGAIAWEKLHGTVTSQTAVEFELDGVTQMLPLPALINLRSHPDESVRRRAYECELRALESIREPLAACMNSIKGAVNTLDRRRGRSDALHSAVDNAHIDRQTLEAMLVSMEASLPTFRKYFRAKAKRLGKKQLAWWDLFAPISSVDRTFSFEETRDFILNNFATFSEDLVNLAKTAFDKKWIDAEPRANKVGGAFCISLAGVKESRILCNFDGSLDQVSTIAHELGHAFHSDCAFRAGKTELQSITPMTLAETASIMCETIIMQATMQAANSAAERLGILEIILIGYSQVIVDIYSRYLFEKEVFEKRQQAELSPDELCEIMRNAQLATYGDGLDSRYLHPYMWTWKPHYYSLGLSFYNFPYAFGLLFGLGLYALYQQRGADFVPEYQQLLATTGEASAADLAARFNIDIRSRKFWDDSMAVINDYVERYCAM